MAAHFERDDGKGEKESDPEASPHIAIFFAGAVRCGRHDRLKCHATDGAASGTGLLDFGMHRAGPDGALRSEEHKSELKSLMRISYAVSWLNKNTHYLRII